jgi:hypothetical protein
MMFGMRATSRTRVNVLEMRPERCVRHGVDEQTGLAVLLVPRFRSGPLARWLQPRIRPERAHVRVRLDRRGSWLWLASDGSRTVGQLLEDFRNAFPEEADPTLASRLCQFFRQLAMNRFVCLSASD